MFLLTHVDEDVVEGERNRFGIPSDDIQDDVPKLVYLAGPYRPYTDSEGKFHSIASNVAEAARLGVEVWKRGHVAVIPHTMTYFPKLQRQDGGINGVPPEQFLAGELELLRRCDVLVLLPAWRVSKGATAEKEYAERHGIPVLEWDEFVAWEGE